MAVAEGLRREAVVLVIRVRVPAVTPTSEIRVRILASEQRHSSKSCLGCKRQVGMSSKGRIPATPETWVRIPSPLRRSSSVVRVPDIFVRSGLGSGLRVSLARKLSRRVQLPHGPPFLCRLRRSGDYARLKTSRTRFDPARRHHKFRCVAQSAQSIRPGSGGSGVQIPSHRPPAVVVQWIEPRSTKPEMVVRIYPTAPFSLARSKILRYGMSSASNA